MADKITLTGDDHSVDVAREMLLELQRTTKRGRAMNRLPRDTEELLDRVYGALGIEKAGGAKAEETLGLPRKKATEASV